MSPPKWITPPFHSFSAIHLFYHSISEVLVTGEGEMNLSICKVSIATYVFFLQIAPGSSSDNCHTTTLYRLPFFTPPWAASLLFLIYRRPKSQGQCYQFRCMLRQHVISRSNFSLTYLLLRSKHSKIQWLKTTIHLLMIPQMSNLARPQ